MPLDLETSEDDEDSWCNDVWDIGMPPPRLQPIYEKIGRSLEEILQLEVELIEEHTELEPVVWIWIYASRFREILNDDPSIPKWVLKRQLYFKN